MTLVIQIGNSDDKLTQKEWHSFVHEVVISVGMFASKIYFNGGSECSCPWQNHAWVLEVQPRNLERLRKRLLVIRQNFKQESIAWTEGETIFI